VKKPRRISIWNLTNSEMMVTGRNISLEQIKSWEDSGEIKRLETPINFQPNVHTIVITSSGKLVRREKEEEQ
jgi:hypothetical protein